MAGEALRSKAQQLTELIALIQQYPQETRRIVAAVEDGLVLGPARVMSWEPECEPLSRRP